jgi:hypothetical protein
MVIRHLIRSLWLFIIFTILIACTPEDTKKGARLSFFDLEGYVSQQVQLLQNDQPKAVKSVSLDAQIEEKVLSTLDYRKELELFAQADINKPAWRDKYTVDSVFNQAGVLESLTYEATDDKIPTRRLHIDFDRGEVSRILVEESFSSAIADTRRELTFMPGLGYQVVSVQTGKAGNKNMRINVSWP